MINSPDFHIACPQCNYSNAVTVPVAKYKEVVYQLCNDNEGYQDHNMKDQIKCDSCHNRFDFYWCAGHTVVENDTNLEI
jgi:hypothetical protein